MGAWCVLVLGTALLALSCHPVRDTARETGDPVPPVEDTGPDPCEDGAVTCDGDLCWVRFCGGTFDMGRQDGEEDEAPVHAVTVAPFEMLRNEVTVEAYGACVAEGTCPAAGAPVTDATQCHLGVEGYEDHPMNCADAAMAAAFCGWAGGGGQRARLPSEAEWEYAARSGGQPALYPWGDGDPSCDRVVINDCLGDRRETRPACSVPEGNTSQGLCDMAGNAIEWVADAYHGSYVGAPGDGSAWLDPPTEFQVMRGGGVGCAESVDNRNRVFHAPDFWYAGQGFRCAR